LATRLTTALVVCILVPRAVLWDAPYAASSHSAQQRDSLYKKSHSHLLVCLGIDPMEASVHVNMPQR
jgi:hypothetical protein